MTSALDSRDTSGDSTRTQLEPQPHLHSQRRAFSPEIHGLRGLALTMVVAFHLFGNGRVSGGVDVFLIVSAYLITGSLSRALRAGSFSVISRWARTFSRLLPAALLTIVTTVGLGVLILPRSALQEILRQAAASATFTENIYLSTAGMEYGAAAAETSPFQHFWSLSMQGQFLALWPLAAFLLLLVSRRWSGNLRTVVFIAIAWLMTAGSFFYAIHAVAVNQTAAYYSLPARLWEFGLGAVATAWVAFARKKPGFWGALGWVGVAMILSSGFVVDGAHLFPGPWALWPGVGTVLVLLAAESGGARQVGLTGVLSLRPVRWLANLGYTLYLWHWPILILFLAYRSQTSVRWWGAVAVLAVSLFLAEFSNRFVTAPVAAWANRKQGKRGGPVRILAALIGAIALVAGLAWWGAALEGNRKAQALAAGKDASSASTSKGDTSALDPNRQFPGAAALAQPEEYDVVFSGGPRPQVDAAVLDGTGLEEEGCVAGASSSEVLWCQVVEGKPGGKRVVLAGGSHDVQWYQALRGVALEEGWELIVVGKNGCRLSMPDPDHNLTDLCWDWNPLALEQIISLEPDAVFSLGTVTQPAGRPEVVHQGQIEYWEELAEAGIPVVALRDNPRFEWRVPGCLETATDPSECGVDRSVAYPGEIPTAVLETPGVYFIDTADWFCDQSRCEPIVGNVVVYRDQGHFTATYATSMAPYLLEALEVGAPFLFSK